MNIRARRLATGVALLVAALFIGRWSADLLAERWWAATISPAAVTAVTRWRLLGFALDAIAVLIATCWFALQAIVVARSIASVQVARQVGNLRLREAIPTRILLLGAVATGVLLGLVTGAGARQWRAPVALAWQGVTYGHRDPLLNEDIGVYVSQLPLWDVAHGFAALLAVLGLCFVVMLYIGIGAIRREESELVVHPYARRHIGLLLAVAAAVISVGYLLAPYHFITTPMAPLSNAGALTRIRSAQVMAGVALGIGMLSVIWIRRGRHALLAGGWSILAMGALVERVIVPALTAEASAPPGGEAQLQRFDDLAWHLSEAEPTVPTDTIPSAPAVWDQGLLARSVADHGGALLAATQTTLPVDGGVTPAWLIATSVSGDAFRMDVLAVQEGMGTRDGPPVSLRPVDSPPTRPVWRTVGEARLLPNSQDWRAVPTGVAAGGPVRRLLLSWARQAGGLMLQVKGAAIDWHLDPTERAEAVLPMASWLESDIAMVGGRPMWVVQGLIPLERFPLAATAQWKGRTIGGLVPGFIAVMDPVSGGIQFYLDPGADSSAASWSRFSPGLIAPSDALPAEIRNALSYPTAWFDAQLQVLESDEWAIGKRPGRFAVNGVPARAVPIWRSSSQPGRQSAFEDPERRTLSALVTAQRSGGIPSLRVERYDGMLTSVENSRELERLWGKALPLMHLRDSARAAGDTVGSGPVHWFIGGGTLAAWQPVFSIPTRGSPTLLWVSTSLGATLGGGRTVSEAWNSVAKGAASGAAPAFASDGASLARARLWMMRADSALARGDLTAFGRAIEELRAVLKP